MSLNQAGNNLVVFSLTCQVMLE